MIDHLGRRSNIKVKTMLTYAGQNHFEMFNSMLKQYGIIKAKAGAEIGVRTGEFAEFIIRNNPEITLLCVDPYTPYLDCGVQYTKEMQDKIKQEARVRLGTNVKWIYKPSVEAAKEFPKETYKLDFVFIDAEHTYEACKSDIEAWAPNIRPGGFLAGHDHDMVGVNKAVYEYAAKRNRDVFYGGPVSAIWIMEM